MKTISSHLKVCILSVNGRSTKVKKMAKREIKLGLAEAGFAVSGLEKKSETKPHIKCPPCLVWKTPLADLISVKALFCALRTYPKTGINLRFSCWPLHRRCRKLHETWVQQARISEKSVHVTTAVSFVGNSGKAKCTYLVIPRKLCTFLPVRADFYLKFSVVSHFLFKSSCFTPVFILNVDHKFRRFHIQVLPPSIFLEKAGRGRRSLI